MEGAGGWAQGSWPQKELAADALCLPLCCQVGQLCPLQALNPLKSQILPLLMMICGASGGPHQGY